MKRRVFVVVWVALCGFMGAQTEKEGAIWEFLREEPAISETTKVSPREFKVIFLGTAGPQMPRGEGTRSGPAQLVVIDDDVLMIDAGPGATVQLARTGIEPWRVRYLFFTHIHHYDHVSDYDALAFTKWLTGASRGVIEPLYVFGPEGLGDFTKTLFEDLYGREIRNRSQRRPWMGLKVKEIDDGVIWRTSKWQIEARHVPHSPNAFAYRVEAGGKSIVISGDIGPVKPVGGALWRGVVEIAKNADLFVIDALHPTPQQIATVANEAKVKRLVLSHFQERQRPDRIVTEIARLYKGSIIIAEDLKILRP